MEKCCSKNNLQLHLSYKGSTLCEQLRNFDIFSKIFICCGSSLYLLSHHTGNLAFTTQDRISEVEQQGGRLRQSTQTETECDHVKKLMPIY